MVCVDETPVVVKEESFTPDEWCKEHKEFWCKDRDTYYRYIVKIVRRVYSNGVEELEYQHSDGCADVCVGDVCGLDCPEDDIEPCESDRECDRLEEELNVIWW